MDYRSTLTQYESFKCETRNYEQVQLRVSDIWIIMNKVTTDNEWGLGRAIGWLQIDRRTDQSGIGIK